MKEFCEEKGFAAWFETSAKENINIDDAARALVTLVSTYNQLCVNFVFVIVLVLKPWRGMSFFDYLLKLLWFQRSAMRAEL